MSRPRNVDLNYLPPPVDKAVRFEEEEEKGEKEEEVGRMEG